MSITPFVKRLSLCSAFGDSRELPTVRRLMCCSAEATTSVPLEALTTAQLAAELIGCLTASLSLESPFLYPPWVDEGLGAVQEKGEYRYEWVLLLLCTLNIFMH